MFSPTTLCQQLASILKLKTCRRTEVRLSSRSGIPQVNKDLEQSSLPTTKALMESLSCMTSPTDNHSTVFKNGSVKSANWQAELL